MAGASTYTFLEVEKANYKTQIEEELNEIQIDFGRGN